MTKQQRLEAARLVSEAKTFDDEQRALSGAAVVDIRGSVPIGEVFDLFPSERTLELCGKDFHALARSAGCSWDRGARRWVLGVAQVRKVKDALEVEGFVVALDVAACREVA